MRSKKVKDTPLIRGKQSHADSESGDSTASAGHFTFWISLFAEQKHYVYSQASRSNYRGYLHVLKYLLFIIIILNQKAVMQMNRLAGV